MERGYLVAVLAIIATFTGLSRGFRSVEQWSVLHVHHIGAFAKAECPATAARRAIAKVQTRLRPHYAEEAQLLAEMNVPVVDVQARMAEESATQEVDVSRCARQRAMQETARARRDALRMQRDMERTARDVRIEPLSLNIQLPADFEQQIERSTAMAARIAADQVKVHVHVHGVNPNTATSSEQ